MDNSEDLVSGKGQYLSFNLGGEYYAVDILKVREIKGWEEVRELPDTPGYVKGVLDLRGVIVPIIDLRSRFQLKNVEYTPTTVTIVLAVASSDKILPMGVVVDDVSEVLDVDEKDIRTAPNLGPNINTQYIKGMVTVDERMVILLDVDKLINPEELGFLETIT